MNAALYIRVSSSKQEIDGSSLETQEERCRAFAAERGYDVGMVCRDVFTGSELFDRPGLSELRQAVRARQVDVVIAYALDRLTRHQAHLGLLVSELDYVGARLELVTEEFENTPEGKLLQGVKAYAAEIERLKIAERTQRGVKARAQKGAPIVGCRPPYGYRWVDDTIDGRQIAKARLEIDSTTGPVMRRLFREVLEGRSARSLAAALTSEAIPTPTGRTVWHPSTLTWLLSNPTYKGDAAAFRFKVDRAPGGKRRVVRRDEEGQLALREGTVEPIVSAEEFETVQERLAANKRFAARNNANPERALLRAGIARCGYCGSPVTVNNGSPNPGRQRRNPYYHCHGWAKDRYGCPCYSIPVAQLDEAVWSIVSEWLRNPEVIATEVARRRADNPVESDLALLDRRLAEIARQQQRLARTLATVDDEDAAMPLTAELKALSTQKRQIEKERQELEARQAAWQSTQNRLINLDEQCRRVAANLAHLSYSEKRDLLLALDVRVNIYRADHEPRWELRADFDGIANRTASSSSAICSFCEATPP